MVNEIDWKLLQYEWEDHWKNHPPSYDLIDTFNDFWNARGGRDLYFDTKLNGEEVPRTHLREK